MQKKRATMFLACILTAVLLCACGQQKESSMQVSGKLGQSGEPEQVEETGQRADPKQEASAAQPGREEPGVVEVYSEDGIWQAGDGFEIAYSYHIPQIESGDPEAAGINEEIQVDYTGMAEAALDSMERGEEPGCTSVTYEYFQNDSVLSLVVKSSYYYGIVEEYAVYNYDTEREARLESSDMAALFGISEEALQNAVIRTAARKFDTYHAMEEWDTEVTPGLYMAMRAETLGEDYLSGQPLVYLGEQGEPRVIFPVWSFGDPGMVYFDTPLELSAGRTETFEDALFTVSWNNTGVTIRFHGDQDSREFWEERFDCGWDLEYDKDIPVRGLYSNYTGAALHMAHVIDPPILFLLTEEGRVEYVDLVSCMRGGYFCGGPLAEVDNVVGFTGPLEAGKGGFNVYAACEDGGTVELAAVLAKQRQALPEEMSDSWSVTLTHQVDGGGSYESFYDLTTERNGQMRLQSSIFDVGIDLYYSGWLTLLGVTEDGMVYYYEYYDTESDWNDTPHCGVSAFRTGYDENTWDKVLYVKTLGVGINGLFSSELGAVTALGVTYG